MHVLVKMANERIIASAFSPNGEYLAHADFDGHVRIWETSTEMLLSDFYPTKLQKTTCTCLRWGPGRHLQSVTSEPPKKKKKRKSGVELQDGVDNLQFVAVGMVNGAVLLYSFEQQLHHQVGIEHTEKVTDICWQSDGQTLYSSSLDGHVIEWNVASLQLREKWKAASKDPAGVSSLCLCSSSHLLTAGHTIRMWDLTNKTIIQEFQGHSTQVLRLLPVLKSSAVKGDTSNCSACSYFISAASMDRTVNVWQCHPGSSSQAPITSFLLPEEPVDISVITKRQKLTATIVTTKGRVLVFEHTLNGKLEKPVKPKMVVQAGTAESNGEVPVPILAAVPVQAEVPSMLIVHGSNLQPKFETVALRPCRREVKLLVASQGRSGGKGSQKKTPEAVSKTRLSGTPAESPGSSKEPETKRKRRKSSSERTMEEQLQAMKVTQSSAAACKEKTAPRADQLVAQLSEGLQNSDAKLLTTVFEEHNERTICSTVKLLPQHILLPLVMEINQRMQAHPHSGITMIKWMKQILRTHMSSLVMIPTLMDRLEEMIWFIQCRTQALPHRTAQNAQLQLLLSRIATQQSSSEEEEAMASAEQALIYQDESSEEDVPMELDATMEFGASESEDNWGEID